MINIIVISSLSKWTVSLFSILFEATLVSFCYEYYRPLGIVEFGLASSQFKIIYVLLLISSSLIFFLKPNQQYQEFTKEKNRRLSSRIQTREKEVEEALALKTDLSDLSKLRYKLQKEEVNFSDLVYERVEVCRKLYDEEKEDREFILNVEENIVIKVDRNYMIQLLDNLVINTISYCKKGRISITLNQDRNYVSLCLSDEGIGIPKEELY